MERKEPLENICKTVDCGGRLVRCGGTSDRPLGKCRACGLVQRLSSSGRVGRPAVSADGQPLTGAERAARSRAKRKLLAESQKLADQIDFGTSEESPDA